MKDIEFRYLVQDLRDEDYLMIDGGWIDDIDYAGQFETEEAAWIKASNFCTVIKIKK